MKPISLFLLTLFMAFNSMGQKQIDGFIKEAQDLLAQKQYKQAQLSLQDAINEINKLIAEDIAKSLPAEINGLKADDDGEVNTGAMGVMGGGFTISKSYQHPSNSDNTAEIQILGNSPMLSTINMYMTNPAMMGSEYKSVRVGTQRAVLKSEMDDNMRSTEIQIPLTQTLITIHAEGFASEQDELAFASKLDLAKLKAALGE